MSAVTLVATQHFKATIIKQQTASGTSAAMLQPSVADALAASPPVPTTDGVVPRADNIFVQALPGNSGTVTIMPVNPAVSLGAGHILSAGQSVNLPLRDASKYFVVASAAAQIINIHYQYGTE